MLLAPPLRLRQALSTMLEAAPDPSRLPNLLAIGAGLGLFAWSVASHFSMADDAYIGFRYVDHWLAGHGLVWNEGERVEGYTNFLWIALLAAMQLLGLRPEISSLVLGVASLALILASVYRAAGAIGGRVAAPAACLLVAGSLPLARWSASGLETALFAALVALANAELARASRPSWRSSAAFGLASLARPDAVVVAGAAFLGFLPLRGPDRLARLRALVLPAALFLAFPAAHALFRLGYYGDLLPNTFYAKLSGDLPGLWSQGVTYLVSFVIGGGGLALLLPLLGLMECPRARSAGEASLLPALGAQIALQAVYVASIGGDAFEYHRFLAPVVPSLAVLSSVGLLRGLERLGARAGAAVPFASLALAALETGLAYTSVQEVAFRQVRAAAQERESLSAWLSRRFPQSSVLAINAAGLIPYRTGFRSIDMLGLCDRHVARSGFRVEADGTVLVGHYKHDGAYVCRRAPDLVLTSGAHLFPGRSADEAIIQAAANTFPGDREFLRMPECHDKYRPFAEELSPGRFAVVYTRSDAPLDWPTETPTTAEAWFRRGLSLMQHAHLAEAALAFEASLRLRPDHPTAQTNLAYCLLDLHQADRARALFASVSAQHPDFQEALFGLALSLEKLGRRDEAIAAWRKYLSRAQSGSPWAGRALQHLELLGADGR